MTLLVHHLLIFSSYDFFIIIFSHTWSVELEYIIEWERKLIENIFLCVCWVLTQLTYLTQVSFRILYFILTYLNSYRIFLIHIINSTLNYTQCRACRILHSLRISNVRDEKKGWKSRKFSFHKNLSCSSLFSFLRGSLSSLLFLSEI